MIPFRNRSFRLLALLVLVQLAVFASAQQQNRIWWFGEYAGLDFSNTPPTPAYTPVGFPLYAPEAAATYCDPTTGQLRLFTNGVEVIDENGLNIQGTGTLNGAETTTQTVIVPQPGSSDLVYVFVTHGFAGLWIGGGLGGGLRYSIIDLSLNGGLGAAVTTDNFLVGPTTEKLTVVKGCTGKDYWIVCHLWDSDAFYSYHLTDNGLNTTPVISNVGVVHQNSGGPNPGYEAIGQMKVSRDYTKLAVVIGKGIQRFELFDFDNSTGQVGPLIFSDNSFPQFNGFQSLYGCEFAPDGSKLYLTEETQNFEYVFQYDLSSGVPATMLASRNIVLNQGVSDVYGGIQLGPDGKIYLCKGNDQLDVINNPNGLGAACDYQVDDLAMENFSIGVLGLPQLVDIDIPVPETASLTWANCGTSQVEEFINGPWPLPITSFEWDFDDPGSGAQNTSTIRDPQHTFSGAGTYSVELIVQYGCTADTIVQDIQVTGGPTALATTAVDASCGLSNGSVQLGSVTGGTGPYQFNFNNQGLSANTNYTGLGAGSYNIVVQDANGCQFNTSVDVNTSGGPTALVIAPVDAACGLSNGSVQLGPVTGGTGPYQFNFNSQGLNANTNYTGLGAGSYTIVVEDANGCTFNTSVNIASTNGPTALATSPVDAACGLSNGSVQLGAVTGGTGPYQFNFNNQGLSANTNYTGLSAGNFTIVVQDASGCTFNTSVNIASTNGPTALATVPVNASCGLNNGSVTLGAVTGGTGPYQFNFNNQGLSANTNYTGLSAGNFTIVVQDANGCTFNTSVNIASTNGPTALATVPVNASCGLNNGSVTLGAVSGGTGPYQFNFNNQGFSANTNYGSLGAGNYTVVVEDANGCQFNTSVNINSTGGPTALATSPVDASCGLTNGSVSLGLVTGGTGPYQFNFDNQGLSANTNYTGLGAGNYTIVVQDANGCQFNTSVNIASTNGPTALATIPVNASCGLDNGSVTLGAVTGGTGPYQFNINNQGLSANTNYTGLGAGNYTIVVQDANGCQFNTSVNIPSTNGPTALATTPVDASCGQNNGSVQLGAVTGGTGPYQFNFDNQGLSANTNYTGLGAGNYTIVVQDANGCQFNTSVNIASTNGPTTLATTPVDASCVQNNGSVQLGAVTGGTGPYQFNFNNQGLSANTNYTGLGAGNYIIVVQDANGCQFNTSVNIASTNGPTALATTPVDASCGQNNGSVQLGAVTGGTGPYQFNFDNQGLSANTSYTGLGAGNYTIVVQDANGCQFNTSVNIASTNGPTAILITPTDATCGQSDGSLALGAITGGTGPFQFSVNGSAFSSGSNYPGLAAGLYTVSVQDANGCTFDTSANIGNVGGPTAVSLTPIDGTCGQPNGSVQLGAVTGGTAPYQFNFNNQGFSANTNYTGLGAGSYTIDVQDAGGCTFSTTVSVGTTTGPTAVTITPTDAGCTVSNGSLQLGPVTGGVGPCQFNFNNQGFSANTNYTALAPGSYPFVVQDANGCTFNTTANVGTLSGPTAIASTPSDENCGLVDGAVQFGAITGGDGPYQIDFNSGGLSTITNYTGLGAGSYTVEVQDTNGCTFSTIIIIGSAAGPTSVAITPATENCGQADGAVVIGAVTGGTPPYQFNFNGQGSSSGTNYSGLVAGAYTIDVQDANGCVFSTSVNVGSTNAPTAIAINPVDAACGNANGSVQLGSVTGGTGPYQFNINGQGFSNSTNYTALDSGLYALIIQDANGCAFDTAFSISSSDGPTDYTLRAGPSSCEGPSGFVEVSDVNGGSAPYTLSVNGQVAPINAEMGDLAPGIYALVITDANGCSLDTTLTIARDPDDIEAVYIPNTFTPNGDGINDVWIISGNCIEDVECRIFDRWGGEIATWTDISITWDGSYKGTPVQDGVYAYLVWAKTYVGVRSLYRGHVTVLR